MSQREYPIDIPADAIADFCRRNRIRKLSLFGSILRDDFGPESDIDVLVEFKEDTTPGLAYFSMQDELSEMLGRPVDLVTPKGLSKYVRNDVIASADEVYAAA